MNVSYNIRCLNKNDSDKGKYVVVIFSSLHGKKLTLIKKLHLDNLEAHQLNCELTKATITRCDLSATILFKLADSYLVAFKFAQ